MIPAGVSDELRLMRAPVAAYRRLAAEPPPPPGVGTLLRRPLFFALLVGCIVTLTTTGQLTPSLAASSVVVWSFVPGLQLCGAVALIAGVRRRRRRGSSKTKDAPPALPLSVAVDLFFAGQGPWALWLLVLAGVVMVALPAGLAALPYPGAEIARASAAIPFCWTAAITYGFCREILGLERPWALAATAAYELPLWGVVYVYAGAATYRLWPFA